MPHLQIIGLHLMALDIIMYIGLRSKHQSTLSIFQDVLDQMAKHDFLSIGWRSIIIYKHQQRVSIIDPLSDCSPLTLFLTCIMRLAVLHDIHLEYAA